MKNFKNIIILAILSFPLAVFGAEPTAAQCPELTGLQKIVGFANFLTIFEIIMMGIGLWSLTILFPAWYKKLRDIFANIPPTVYEVSLYVLSFSLIAAGLLVVEQSIVELGLIGSLLFPLAISYSVQLRKWQPNVRRIFLLLMVAWGIIALLYESPVIGFLSVAALMGLVGFSVEIGQLCYAIGFKDEKVIPTATLTGFVLLVMFITLHIFNLRIIPVMIFEGGAFWLGGLVMYSGLLIMSTKWYESSFPYLPMQILTIVAGIAALVIGNIWELSVFRGIGGTFFILYLVEKPFEIPFEKKESYAAMALGLSIVIGLLIMWAKNHIDIVQPYLLF